MVLYRNLRLLPAWPRGYPLLLRWGVHLLRSSCYSSSLARLLSVLHSLSFVVLRVLFLATECPPAFLFFTRSLLSFCSASLNVLVALFSSSRASSSAAFLLLLCFGFGGSRPELGLQLAAITTTVLSNRSVWCTRQCPLWKIYTGEPYSDSAQYMRAHECS